jgi:TRAP-type C4-dicarboxylate transport system permease small subunit
MRRFLRFCDRIQSLGGALASLLVLLLTGLILTEIVMRSFFDRSTMIADEYSGYLYLAMVFLALGYTFREKGHIRITLLHSRLSPEGQRRLDLFAGFLLLGILAFLLYYSVRMVLDAYRFEMVSETVSETPIWITQLPIPVGTALFLLADLAFLIRRFRRDL